MKFVCSGFCVCSLLCSDLSVVYGLLLVKVSFGSRVVVSRRSDES